ncbi:MAG: hypothetical protein H8E61_07230 [Bacteroidetes bacterium]|nr:hypothetical protein [Bacteroidota bacterium]
MHGLLHDSIFVTFNQPMNLLESDLYVISCFVFAKQADVYVLDPGKKCIPNLKSSLHFVRQRNEVNKLAKLNKSYFLINLSGANTFSFPLDFSKIEGLISFNRNLETSTDYFHTLLHYHTDGNDRIKWILSEHHKKADFMADTDHSKSLVDVNNFFAVIPYVFHFLRLKLGFTGSVAKGKIQVLLKERYLFSFLADHPFDSFSVNIRPAFSSGLVHARFFQTNRWIFSAKRGFSTEGRKRLSNEHRILQLLNKNKFNQLELPVSSEHPDGFLLQFNSTFRQLDYFGIQKLINKKFIHAVFEYINLGHQSLEIKSLLKKTRINEILEHLKSVIEKKKFPRGLSIINYVRVYQELVLIMNSMNIHQKIPASVVNYDLTPAFIGYSKEKIHLLKWENAELAHPLLFDLFEYSFAYIEDFEAPEVEYLINDLEVLKYSSQVEELIQKTGMDFNLHLRLFALLRLSPALILFLNKSVVPPENNIKLYVWARFFESLKLVKKQS